MIITYHRPVLIYLRIQHAPPYEFHNDNFNNVNKYALAINPLSTFHTFKGLRNFAILMLTVSRYDED